jgi:SAM-dependent methyltransferase
MGDLPGGVRPRVSSVPFAVAAFAGAALVFLVEPMAARMVLPRLGGSPAVWNTSLAFFQAALVAGYAYAHVLQRIAALKVQMAVHLAVLALAGLALPLHISGLLGAPRLDQPALWLLGVLALSVGAPFAALSATAPLVQAWYARLAGRGDGEGRPPDPYALYAASNLGSLLALIAYPVLVEPLMPLHAQALAWSLGYGAFAVLILGLAVAARRLARSTLITAASPAGPPPTVGARLIWIGLSAATSSLLLGVTAHITQDVASAPFLWVVPLALYLITFIIAFQARPLIGQGPALYLQAAFVPLACALLSLLQAPWLWQLGSNLGAFFFTALVCHQALAARRPEAGRLTDFYLCLALGGVIGGAVNAFAAPVLLDAIWEYPVVLGLACLARPWGRGRLDHWQVGIVSCAVLCLVVLALPHVVGRSLVTMLLTVAGGCAFLMRRRGAIYAALILGLGTSSYGLLFKGDRETWRSFFGVVQLIRVQAPVLGPMKILVHGSTLHGAQAQDPGRRCTPTTYYGNGTPIGQVLLTEWALRPHVSIGVVGLGSGSVATYSRPGDTLRFFEIDPLVVRLAMDPAKLSFVHGCAKGPVTVTLGDARLSLAAVPDRSFDLLMVDAFSSDSVPTHLLTTEAIRSYLRVIKPDGVVLLHLSNRNLELEGPAAAGVRAAGGVALAQDYASPAPSPYVESGAQAVLAAHDLAALKPFKAHGDWIGPRRHARAWTDDYVNVFGALAARLAGR